MYIIDSHCDTLMKVDKGGTLVNPYNLSLKFNQLQFYAMFCTYKNDSLEDSYRRALRFIEHFTREVSKKEYNIAPVKTYRDIVNAFENNKNAALLTVEGGSCIDNSVEVFEEFYNAGVRVFGLAWHSNDLAKCNDLNGSEDDTGLGKLGRSVVEKGNELGMIFDVSHLSDKSFWDLAEISKKPIVATHSNFRAICDHSRNLTDEMAREIFRQDGIIGLNLAKSFIHSDKDKQTAENLFRHLDHCLELGGEDHIGFGCDIDGIGSYPDPLDESSSMHDRLLEIMAGRGYSNDLIEKVAYKNYLSFLKKYL